MSPSDLSRLSPLLIDFVPDTRPARDHFAGDIDAVLRDIARLALEPEREEGNRLVKTSA